MTQSKITIAQISDVHLPFPNWPPVGYVNVKRVLGLLNWLRKRRYVHSFEAVNALIGDMQTQGIDHIVVSGDLVNLGLPQEYRAALGWLNSVGTPDRVSVVPGNHDIYCALDQSEDCRTIWSDYISTGQSKTAGSRDLDGLYPTVRTVGSVALVGLNSAMPTPPFIAQGRIGNAQFERVRRVIASLNDEGMLVCLVLHHPPLAGFTPPRRALRDTELAEELIKDGGIGLVLYGHNHRDRVDFVETRCSPPGYVAVCGAASGSALVRHKHEPRARYYLYEFEEQGDCMTVTRVTRGLSPDGGLKVAELARQQLFPQP